MNNEIASIFVEIFPTFYGSKTEDEIITMFDNSSNQYKIYTHKVDGKIVACATIHESSGVYSSLKNFGVLPEYRRNGYATILFNNIREQEKKLFKLECDAEDDSAIKFYDSLTNCKRYDIIFIST